MGCPKGTIPWNKGKPGYSRKTNGFKHSKETRRRISESIKKNPTRYWKDKKCPWITERNLRENPKRTGENAYNWKGGKTRRCQHHMNYQYKKWRSAVFERDNWTCQTCGDRGVILEAHHIKGYTAYPKLRYVISNGVSLCQECHRLTFKARK